MNLHVPAVRTFAGTIRIPAGIDAAFELFSPLGEKLWVPDWDPELLHPAGATWAAGLIFRTRTANGDAIWIVTRLDRATHAVEYHRVEATHYVVRVAVRCTAAAPDVTAASIEYEFVGLSDAGNAEIAAMDEGGYVARMSRWQEWIERHLRDAAAR